MFQFGQTPHHQMKYVLYFFKSPSPKNFPQTVIQNCQVVLDQFLSMKSCEVLKDILQS